MRVVPPAPLPSGFRELMGIVSVELTLQLLRAACLAELSLADFGDMEETCPCEEQHVAGCWMTYRPW